MFVFCVRDQNISRRPAIKCSRCLIFMGYLRALSVLTTVQHRMFSWKGYGRKRLDTIENASRSLPGRTQGGYKTLRQRPSPARDMWRRLIQGGSDVTGTNCDLFTHSQSRSYLNHLVIRPRLNPIRFSLSA
jgi:hypothetical protein